MPSPAPLPDASSAPDCDPWRDPYALRASCRIAFRKSAILRPIAAESAPSVSTPPHLPHTGPHPRPPRQAHRLSATKKRPASRATQRDVGAGREGGERTAKRAPPRLAARMTKRMRALNERRGRPNRCLPSHARPRPLPRPIKPFYSRTWASSAAGSGEGRARGRELARRATSKTDAAVLRRKGERAGCG